MATSIGRVGRHFFANIRYLVHCHDGTTHEYGLCHEDGTAKHVARIRVQLVDDALPYLVQRARHAIHHRCHGSSTTKQGAQYRHSRSQSRLQLVDTVGAQVRQFILALVTKQRYLLASIEIATCGRHMRQILRTCRLAEVLGYLLLDTLHTHLLIVAQGHGPTAIKAQNALSLNR